MSAFEASSPALRVLPLGGCGEVGLNATLLIHGGDALLVDCGVLLGIANAPGVERAVPGFEPLLRGSLRLSGVVLTHGHEDHIGALPSLLAEFDVPVFGTPLTIALARFRLEGKNRPVAKEARRQAHDRLVPTPLGSKAKIGPFSVELIRVTHSLPDCAALYIETDAGRVLHSGDFKLDPAPHDGQRTDLARLSALGAQGIDLLLADSTNAETPGRTTPESEVGLAIDRLIGEAKGRVFVACFASHLHRVEAIMRAAKKHGRRVALVGRALQDTFRIGVEEGQVDSDATTLVAEERLDLVPREELVAIVTGSQGEPQAGLSRLASGRDASLRIGPGDRVILSSRAIPGNERAVRQIANQLIRLGAEVITDRMAPVHCSGHACQGEQAELIQIVKPTCFLPVHGERAMLEAHRKTAVSEGVDPERAMVIEDGESVVLSGGRIVRGPTEEVSRRVLDAEGRALDWGDVRDRQKIGRAGLVVCSIAIDQRSGRLLNPPAVTFRGLSPPPQLVARVANAVEGAIDPLRGSDSAGRAEAARTAIRNELRMDRNLVPEVFVHVLSVDLGRVEP